MKALTISALGAAAALVACGSGSTTPSTPVDIAGIWNYTVTVSNNSVQTTCHYSGPASISQTGDQITGGYNRDSSCTSPGGTVVGSTTGNIGESKIVGNKVSFSDSEGCKYTGVATGNPTTAMAGNASCVQSVGGTDYTFAGRWSANR